MAAVLSGTCLAACLKVVVGQVLTRSFESRRAHACHHIIVSASRCLGHMSACVGCVKGLTRHLAHHMGCIIIATVGNGGAEVGYLKRRKRYLALTDRDTDYCQSVPRSAIVAVIIFGIRNHSSLLARQVNAELVAETHAHHIVAPGGHGILNRVILAAVSHHVIEAPAEVGVARGAYGIDKGYWR